MKKNPPCYAKYMPFIFIFILINGCATNQEYTDPSDPFENYNRSVYKMNDAIDKAVLKPISKGYRAITPAPIDSAISHFFSNLGDISNIINNSLQFKFKQASSDLGRFTVNSTIGILGFLDVASDMNIPKHHEDFGQTLGAWGVDSGPYLVLPLLGPSTVRDGFGSVVGWFTDPVTYIQKVPLRNGVQALRVVDARADLLGASKILDQNSLDPYDFIKEAYLQRRNSLIYDGLVPDDEEDLGIDFDD